MISPLADLCRTALFSALLVTTAALPADAADTTDVRPVGDGIVRVKSSYAFDETVERLKQDIAGKGILFFLAVDQAKLGADAGVNVRPSTLLIFGNPPLGTQFITSNANAGLDWPVRLLVTQDERGAVWAVYTDFQWIAQRHGIRDRDPQFAMANKVVASITSSVAPR
ncbi:MAG: DUF302 domain-containing protein [Hyphomicrobiaceae bacterium]